MKYRIAKKIVNALTYMVMGCPGGRVTWTDRQIRDAYRVFGKRHGADMSLTADYITFTRRMLLRMVKGPPQTFIYHKLPVTH